MLSLAFLTTTLLTLATASPVERSVKPVAKRCTSDVSTFDDLATAVSSGCTTITIGALTVPAETTMDLSNLADGTTITLNGDITFTGTTPWDGPLVKITGDDITFDGNGYTLDGQGASYWDSLGGNGGVSKPRFFWTAVTGTISNFIVLNPPCWVFSINNMDTDGAFTLDSVTIDARDGDATDSSTGDPLAHNTDGFDVEGTDVTISNCVVYNQDDCLAIGEGSNINFSNNYCSGGHGISIGGVDSDMTVSNIAISGNTVVDSVNGVRIKTDSGATNSVVSNITYTDNCISGATQYGIQIDQDYLNSGPTGVATNGVEISDVSFLGSNTVEVGDDAEEVYVLCGTDCVGTWDWSGLTASGGTAGSISGDPPITGFSI